MPPCSLSLNRIAEHADYLIGKSSLLCLILSSTSSYFTHNSHVVLLSVQQQCAPAESLHSATEAEVAEAVTAWKKGTAGVPKPRKRVHPM